MKKTIFAIALFSVCTLTGLTVHTQITRFVPEQVRLAFDINFNEASVMYWERVPDGYKAVFDQGKGRIDAYFSQKGEFKGVGRYIESGLLPGKVLKKLERKFAAYAVEEIYEYTSNVYVISYFITVNNEKVRKIVKFFPSGKLLKIEVQQIKKGDGPLVWNKSV